MLKYYFFAIQVERHLSILTGQESGGGTDIRVTACNPFERIFNNPFE